MMKLFYSPFHSFVHKSLVTAHECGLWDSIEFVPTFPFKNNAGEDQGDRYSIAALNPLNKVPTLALDDGSVIFGSQNIIEYMDSVSRAERIYPQAGAARWEALTRLALADTMFEATVQMVMEGWYPPEQQHRRLFEWIWPKIVAGLDHLERDSARGFGRFDVGQVGMLQALSYIDFRASFYKAGDPVYPSFDWKVGRPHLTAWFDVTLQRPSVRSHYQRDYEGDKSAEHCQRKLQEVLAARRERGLS